jgi:hypothetical protein
MLKDENEQVTKGGNEGHPRQKEQNSWAWRKETIWHAQGNQAGYSLVGREKGVT